MALYLYFKKKNLPDPNGPLAQSVPSISIEAANSNIRSVIESRSDTPPRKEAMIGKRAAEHGVVAAVRYYMYIKQFLNLKENTVRDWRNACRIERVCTCIMWGRGQRGHAYNTKFLPRMTRIVQIHESFTPQKLPAIWYIFYI